MRLILHYLKRYKLLLFFNVISVVGFVLVELGIPTILSEMINNGVLKNDKQYIYNVGGRIFIIAILGVLGTIAMGYCCARISTLVTRDIRNDVFKKIQSFSHEEMNHFGISSLITRTNNDAFQILTFMNVILRTALMTPAMIIVSFSLTFMTSVKLSLIIASTIPLIIIGVIIVGKISSPISEKQQKSIDGLNRIFRENLTGIRVIRSFNNDEYESQRFGSENVKLMNQTRKLFKLMASTEPVFFFLMNIAALLIYFFAARMIDANTLEIGNLVAFLEYLFHAMFSVMLFCMVFMMYPRANVSAKRILEILKTEPHITSKQDLDQTNLEKENTSGVVFKNVTFAYPDGEEAVLRDISFEAVRGETVAFIGSTGSGKSTLVQLVPRFYDATSGSVLIDGVDVKDMNITSLRNKIGFVAQRANLFSGTIEENIRFGKEDATKEEIIQASKVAQAYDFIMEKPNQFDEKIVEGATNVSGGQKQRLSIARSLVRNPQIYIYDDSFGALDFKTDAKLRYELKKAIKNKITLIVAQRVSTIMDADKIIVLNEGRIAGLGTHKQLLASCPIYYEIAASQLSKEELQYD